MGGSLEQVKLCDIKELNDARSRAKENKLQKQNRIVNQEVTRFSTRVIEQLQQESKTKVKNIWKRRNIFSHL